jgi:hypothetical protein
LFIVSAEAASFIFEPQDVIGVKGQEVRVECKAKGDPVPQIRWTKEGGKYFEWCFVCYLKFSLPLH